VRFAAIGPELDGVPRIAVGARGGDGARLALSNAPGSRTPRALLADTHAEIALRLLRSAAAAELIGGSEIVTGERCDADALLAVWALLQPEDALARAERVAAAARAGAFAVRRTSEAAQFACWVRGFRREEGLADDADAFRAMLPLVARALDAPRDFDLTWIGEYSDLIHDAAMLDSGAVQIEEHPALDLAVMETPLRLHDLVRFSALEGFRVLTVRTENTYMLEYRRESGVLYQSRRPLPRLDLRPLATRLGFFERREGRWRAEPLDLPAPRLLLDRGDGQPAPSGIDAETVIAEVLDFFTANAGRRDLAWSPYDVAAE
jgi:hypothetical protein